MNKPNKKVWFSLLTILLAVHISFAQDETAVYRDFESWTAIEVKYKFHKKWELGLEGQLRTKDNASAVDQYFTQLQIGYAIFDNFELGAGLRNIRNNDTRGAIQGYEHHLRLHLDASFKHKLNDLSMKYRLRYNNRDELDVSALDGDSHSQYLRFKTSLTYNISNWKLDPEFAAELFNHIAGGEETGFDKYRLTLGTSYNIKRFGKIGLYYRMERTLNTNVSATIDILKLEYSYTFGN